MIPPDRQWDFIIPDIVREFWRSRWVRPFLFLFTTTLITFFALIMWQLFKTAQEVNSIREQIQSIVDNANRASPSTTPSDPGIRKILRDLRDLVTTPSSKLSPSTALGGTDDDALFARGAHIGHELLNQGVTDEHEFLIKFVEGFTEGVGKEVAETLSEPLRSLGEYFWNFLEKEKPPDPKIPPGLTEEQTQKIATQIGTKLLQELTHDSVATREIIAIATKEIIAILRPRPPTIVESGDTILHRIIRFSRSGSYKGADVDSQIDAVAQEWKTVTSPALCSLLVVGHTDTRGTDDVNAPLSKRRAEYVAKRLNLKLGIANSDIQAWGAQHLQVLTRDGQDEKENRRAEVTLTCHANAKT